MACWVKLTYARNAGQVRMLGHSLSKIDNIPILGMIYHLRIKWHECIILMSHSILNWVHVWNFSAKYNTIYGSYCLTLIIDFETSTHVDNIAQITDKATIH